MTEENSLDNTDTNADVETVDETTVVNDDNTDDVEVDEAEKSEKEDGLDAEDVETLRAEIENLKGKLKTVRTAADKWQGTSKTASVENLRLKAALKAGLSDEDLVLITGNTQEEIEKQVERVTKLNSPQANKYISLAGEKNEPLVRQSSMSKKLDAELAKLNLSNKGF